RSSAMGTSSRSGIISSSERRTADLGGFSGTRPSAAVVAANVEPLVFRTFTHGRARCEPLGNRMVFKRSTVRLLFHSAIRAARHIPAHSCYGSLSSATNGPGLPRALSGAVIPTLCAAHRRLWGRARGDRAAGARARGEPQAERCEEGGREQRVERRHGGAPGVGKREDEPEHVHPGRVQPVPPTSERRDG